MCIVNSLFGVYVSSKQKAKRHCRCIFVFITSDIVIATFNTWSHDFWISCSPTEVVSLPQSYSIKPWLLGLINIALITFHVWFRSQCNVFHWIFFQIPSLLCRCITTFSYCKFWYLLTLCLLGDSSLSNLHSLHECPLFFCWCIGLDTWHHPPQTPS